jgi:argininosuccinate synthase
MRPICSGGLDTSTILLWLIEQGYDVIAYAANLGQKEDFDAVTAKGMQVREKAYIYIYIYKVKYELISEINDYLFNKERSQESIY